MWEVFVYLQNKFYNLHQKLLKRNKNLQISKVTKKEFIKREFCCLDTTDKFRIETNWKFENADFQI